MTSYADIDSLGKDSDIEIINREKPDSNESLDTPSFMQSLDLPTPLQLNGILEDLDPQRANISDFLPNLGALPDFGDSHAENDQNNSNALTRYSNPLPPLPSLTEPVITNLPYQSLPLVPEYAQNSSRPALMGAKRRKEQVQKTKPAFVVKIWNMVNDPANHEYIRWTEDGLAFVVVHREEFMKLILPNYFKHNNFASFVRQLNMYGWHKVQDINSGTMKDANNEEILQFKNPDFVRGREDLLDNIVRNKTGGMEDQNELSLVNLQVMTTEVDKLKMTQLAMLEDMRRMRTDNQNLWQEVVNSRERERKQSQMMLKIITFIEAAYGKSAGKIFEVQSGPLDSTYNNQMLTYNGQNKQNFRNRDAAQNSFTASPQRPRLMLMDSAYQKTPQSVSPSVSTGKDGSVEEIVRDGGDYDHSNKFLQQFINSDSVASPRHYFPELQNLEALQDGNDDFVKIEPNMENHGQDLAHTQEWIDEISKQQQERGPSTTDSAIDDLMSEILNDANTESLKSEGGEKRPSENEGRASRKRARR